MRTFEQSQKTVPQTASAKPTTPGQQESGQSQEVDPILYLPRRLGNLAAQPAVQTHPEPSRAAPTAAAARPGHDFSRIQVHHVTRGVLQPKLAVNTPGDEFEQEADRVAEQVMGLPDSQMQPPSPPDEGRPTGRPGPGGQAHERLQTLRVGRGESGPTEAPPVAHEILRSPGQPLDSATRSYFEPRFGHDFSRVRVHHDREAAQAARSINARAYTAGHQIVFGDAQYSPRSHEGQKLLAHELTHVMQQSEASGAHGAGSQGGQRLLQRTPAEAQALIGAHTSWGNLNEATLGRELLRLALAGQLTLADEVLTALGSTDRDDVAYEFMVATSDPQLVRLAGANASRQFLHRLFDELTSGSVAAEEQQQADRILQVTARQTVSVADFQAAATSRRTKIFPFRLPGFTVLNPAAIEARRQGGGVWVHSFVHVLGTAEFRAETATLPTEYFLSGIVLPETEVIGVRLYDQGGIIHYTTPLFLIQLANATDQRVLEKIIEAAGIGLTLGTGALAGLGVEATMAARVLLWADRAAFVLGTLTSALREHRSWLVAHFGPGFMDAVDIVHSAVAIYGLARVAIEAPRLIQGLRDSYRAFRDAARARSGLSSGEQATIQQVTQSTDELVQQIDNIQGARPPARPGAAEPAAPSASTGPRPSEPTPAGPRQAPPEGAAPGPAAPAAAGAAGGYRPTQPELESYADRAWRFLGGRGSRPAVTETPLQPGTAGQYRSGTRTIEVGTGASDPGSVVETVWHEASHGRIRDLIGFMNEHLGASWQRTLLRPLDEIVSYFIGGLGRVIQGPTLASRLYGILSALGAPFSALGSMASRTERALWAAHMVAFAAALIWAEVKILLSLRERHESRTPQPAPAP